MWLAAFRFREKIYRFAINGRSGEVQGERQHSFWKIAFAFAAVILFVVVVFLLAGQGQQLDGGFMNYQAITGKFE